MQGTNSKFEVPLFNKLPVLTSLLKDQWNKIKGQEVIHKRDCALFLFHSFLQKTKKN